MKIFISNIKVWNKGRNITHNYRETLQNAINFILRGEEIDTAKRRNKGKQRRKWMR